MIAAATGSHASDSAEQSAHRLPQDIDAERLDHHRRLHGPDELLVGAPISVARDEQERRPRWRPPLQRDADDYRGTRALVIFGVRPKGWALYAVPVGTRTLNPRRLQPTSGLSILGLVRSNYLPWLTC